MEVFLAIAQIRKNVIKKFADYYNLRTLPLLKTLDIVSFFVSFYIFNGILGCILYIFNFLMVKIVVKNKLNYIDIIYPIWV